MTEENKSLENSILDSVAISNTRDIVADFAEITLDTLLNDGAGKDIPIIGTILRIYGASVSIRDRLFTKKVLRFLFEVGKTSSDRRQEFITQLKTDPEKSRRTGEALIQILEHLDSFDKATIVGKIFRARIEGRLDETDTSLLWGMVDRVHLSDLEDLFERYKEGKTASIDEPTCERLAYAGFMRLAGNTPGFWFAEENDPYAKISKYGELLFEKVLLSE